MSSDVNGKPFCNSAGEPFPPALFIMDEAICMGFVDAPLPMSWARRIIVISAPTDVTEFYRLDPPADQPHVVEGSR